MSTRVFMCIFENVSRPSPEAIAAHVAHLRALDDRGALVLCGPFVGGDGGVVCYLAGSRDEALTLADADPFVKLGHKRYRLHEIERATRDNRYLLPA